jgi:hypothetical protein
MVTTMPAANKGISRACATGAQHCQTASDPTWYER